MFEDIPRPESLNLDETSSPEDISGSPHVHPRAISRHKSPRLSSAGYPALETEYVFDVDKCPYDTLYVDLTYKCNMACHFCYNPVRTLPDLDLGYFKEVCARLPKTTLFRFLGGEPTLHPKFLDILDIAHRHKHVASVVTNGLKFTDAGYAREVKGRCPTLITSLSLDGGRADNAVYREIVNAECAEQKMTALENMADAGFKRVAIGAIIVRNLNEAIVPELLDIAREYPNTVRYIHYRTAGEVGRWRTEFGAPYTVSDIKDLLRQSLGAPAVNEPHRMIRDGAQATDGRGNPLATREKGCPDRICRGCCNEFWLDPKLQISIIEFASGNAAKCWHRGKLMNDFTVQPFFENVIRFSEEIERGK